MCEQHAHERRSSLTTRRFSIIDKNTLRQQKLEKRDKIIYHADSESDKF